MRNLRNTDVDVPYRLPYFYYHKTQNFYPLSVYYRPDDEHSIYWTLLKKYLFSMLYDTNKKKPV